MMDEYKQHFFAEIQRSEGAPAPDWKAVLESLPAKGWAINPRPGERPPLDAPHGGMSVMVGTGGARGRIWLPTDTPQRDHNGNQWFTHEVQVIADGPTPGSFVWAWRSMSGAQPRPFSGSQPAPAPQPQPQPQPAPEPQPAPNNDALIAAIREGDAAIVAKLDELRVAVIQAADEIKKGIPTLGGLFGRR